MPTSPPNITPSPQVPQRGVKSTFNNYVDAFVTWMSASASQFVAVGTNVYNNAVEAFNSATAAATSAGNAATSEANAQAAANAAGVTAGATLWVSGQTVAQDAARISPLDRRTYRRKTATGSGTTDPALDPTNYVVLSAVQTYTIFRVREEYASGTAGASVGANTTNTFTRVFNTTKVNSIPGATVSGNQFTLPAGLYEVEGMAPYRGTAEHRVFLYCVTDGAIALLGQSTYGYQDLNNATVEGEITIASGTKVYELRHYVKTQGTQGDLGWYTGQSGQPEVYAHISFKKLG